MPIIYDNGLIMAIIAINMTIIGLTSLADQKCVIGVDYGRFLITKFKLVGLRMYYWLIIFALINIVSLFLMFVEIPLVRFVNFIFLIISLVFAIYYFFSFIIVENKWVQEQIYMTELLGLYYDDSNTSHLEIDKLVHMNPGNRTNNKISTNVINYFNVFNGDTQKVFNNVFGPESLIYSDKPKVVKFRKNLFGIKRYNYRVSSGDSKVKEISFEFFQLFRFSEMQDKWAIDILRIINGDPNTYKSYDIFRLYNLARLIVQIRIFGCSENLFKYKFVYYIKEFIFKTVEKPKYDSPSNIDINHVKEVERYMLKSLVSYVADTINIYSELQFINCVQEFLNEIILQGKYKGYLSVQETVETFVYVSISLSCKKLQDIIDISLSLYFEQETKVTCIDIEKLKDYANDLLNRKNNNNRKVNLFSVRDSEFSEKVTEKI
jgi:hypothetical protein